MPEYRKKPVTITAEQWDGTPERALAIAAWANGVNTDPAGPPLFYQQAGSGPATGEDGVEAGEIIEWPEIFTILTLEGTMTVSPGDFVIQGVQGEFYPCKPGIFAESYDEVTDAE